MNYFQFQLKKYNFLMVIGNKIQDTKKKRYEKNNSNNEYHLSNFTCGVFGRWQ